MTRLALFGMLLGLAAAWWACSVAPGPFIVRGPGTAGSELPTLTILEPNADVTIDQGSRFLIRWVDSDRDSAAVISFALVRTTGTNVRIRIAQGIEENDLTGTDSVSVGTSAIPVGDYQLEGIIDDRENDPVVTYAMTTGIAGQRRAVITITEPGTGPQQPPPVIAVTQPVFNLSVAQDDPLRISVQPTLLPPADTRPYDLDSDVTLFVVLDLDLDPNNDDPSNENPLTTDDGIVVLRQLVVAAGSFAAMDFEFPVDLRTIPPRPGGLPYFIRVTADDGTNPRVHSYASGQISVVELAAGIVDLADIGRTKAGARFYGFNPGAATGSSTAGISDFDNDNVADFVIVARFGNPRNFGLVGEAYLIYGQDRLRFGGAIPVNSVSETVSGVIFEAPPARTEFGGIPIFGRTESDGITSVSFIRDVSGDGRPELLFGLPHVSGAFQSMDFDPADESARQQLTDDLAWTFTQGRFTVQIGDDQPFESPLYSGIDDVVISSAAPNTGTGAASELTWRDDPTANVREWTLIKFRDLVQFIPDVGNPFVDLSSIDASLLLSVVNRGGPATLHLLLVDFNEQTTFSTFGPNGGPPQAGIHYEVDSIGTVDAENAERVEVDISPIIVDLFNGVFIPDNNEIRFILVPSASEGANQAGVVSSESPALETRPELTIAYTRTDIFGSFGCYPDPYANNVTDDDIFDLYAHAGGMAVIVNSQNRDNESVTGINTQRLEETVIAVEMVGQEPAWALDEDSFSIGLGDIFARADNVGAGENRGNESEEPGRISGARIIGGWYDYIDHAVLRQPAREDSFGQTVASIGDLNNDGLDEILISAPRNERYIADTLTSFGFQSTHFHSTAFLGSIAVVPGFNYNLALWREKSDDADSTASIPVMFQHRFLPPFGSCVQNEPRRYAPLVPEDTFEVFAEDSNDMLGGAISAGDFNQDGLDDILCGAPMNNRPGRSRTGAAYILYGRNVLSDFRLADADDPLRRAPMLRIRGVKDGDQVGWKQATGLDVNGDRIDDVFIASPRTDFGSITRAACGSDFNRDGVIEPSIDFSSSNFNNCRNRFQRPEEDLFSDDACKVFDYDNDLDIDDDDEKVVTCLRDGGTNCCANVVDNGFVGIIFGGVFTDGDRDITQVATTDLAGTVFFGSGAGHRAGFDVSSAGDFNQDGFGDLLIVVPGETRLDRAGRQRLGVVYLVFGGTHLINTVWDLSQVGSEDLPGMVMLSPYVRGRPNEAPPMSVAFLGDVNRDGFGDIMVGNPRADFIDLSFPQGPNAPSGDAAVGRRRNAGDAYLVYGNNFGSNRGR